MMRIALATEAMRFVRSRVTVVTAILLTVGIAALCGSLLFAVGTSDPQLRAKLGPLLDPGGWDGYLITTGQVATVAGVMGFGVVLSWVYGREFADGTITGLFALPVGRGMIATAKFLVYLGWATVVSVVLAAILVLVGLILGLGPLPADAWPALGRFVAGALLTALIAVPAAWAATIGRGLLAGIATISGIVVVAQIAAVSGIGAWFPFAAVGLWVVSGGTAVSAGQLALIVPTVALFLALTIESWRRMQLDR
jgi:ABC-2 type transport system permease protein